MGKQALKSQETQTGKTTQLFNFGKQRKGLILLVALFIIAGLFVGITTYNSRADRFTDKDFSIMARAAEEVFLAVGGEDISKNESCRYTRPEVYSDLTLFCEVEAVSYLPYISDEQAKNVAKDFEEQITKIMGPHFYGFSKFYENPHNGHAVTTVTPSLLLPKKRTQCSLFIDSNEKAKKAVDYVPERAGDNMIAMSFTCSAETTKEYFPIVYRQS